MALVIMHLQADLSMQRWNARHRGVSIDAASAGVLVTLIDFTLSRLRTIDGSGAYCDLNADPELFTGPKGDCQVKHAYMP
jgi:serine/threonine-protein kinase haspin